MRITILFLILSTSLYAQPNFNLSLLANDDPSQLVNDIWGYVDGSGTEYAIMGAQSSVRIYDLSTPTNPILAATYSGVSSTWRDIKTYQNYAYVIADVGSEGLMIIDMDDIPSNSAVSYWQPSLTFDGSTETLNRCHNIYIDGDYLYMSGCNVFNRGVLIVNISNPTAPQLEGVADLNYSHDVYVQNDIMVTSEIYAGQFALYDVSDKSAPSLLGSKITGNDFTHNAWFSDNGNYVFTTDERSNAFVESYDISDPSNIEFLDKFQPLETAGTNTIPHNTHQLNDFLITSWYTDGVVITDASDPNNLIKVASYDTYSGSSGGFGGCWGAYPFLPSGIVLASDRQTGLYVLQPNYVQASKIVGTVEDYVSGSMLIGVDIEILNTQVNDEVSSFDGGYSTGTADQGSYVVRYSKSGYYTEEFTLNLVNGTTLTHDVRLIPICEEILHIDGVVDRPLYQATFDITSDAQILSGTSTQFQAIKSIQLQPMFTVELGAEFETVFAPCQ